MNSKLIETHKGKPSTYNFAVTDNKINNIEIEKLKAEGNISKTYKAVTSCDKEKEGDKFTIELTLNAQIIVIRNINVEDSLVNGTRGIIKHLGEDFVIINDVKGNIHKIKYFTDTFNNVISSKSSYIIHMPIRICYALSIHKSQGMTIDALELDLGSNIFTCGQSYTALSRAKKLSSIKIIDIDKDSFRTNIDVKKFYKKLFENVMLTTLVYGNINSSDALFEDLVKFTKLFKYANQTTCISPMLSANPFWLCDDNICPINNKTIILNHPNKEQTTNSIMFYYNIGKFTPKLYMLSSMMIDILHDSFFDELRTKQQLGYLVKMYNSAIIYFL